MKKISTFILTLATLFCLFINSVQACDRCTAGTQSSRAKYIAITTPANLNVREKATTEKSAIIDKIPGGTIRSYRDKCNNGWYSLGNGYVSSQYASVASPVAGYFFIKTNGANVNLRKGPSTSFSSITKIPNNTHALKASYTCNGWVRIEYKGMVGWASMDYCKTNWRVSCR